MGVTCFLVCVIIRKHKSNLSTNMRTTVGKKTQWSVEKCELLTATRFSPYFMTAWPWCVFFYQSVYFFTNGVLSCFSSQQYVSVIFVKQCWSRNTHLAKVWFGFPYQMSRVLHWLLCSSLTTQLNPIKPQKNMKKRLEGAALELPPGLTRPGPCEPEFWKNDLPANLFLLCTCTPPKCKKVTPAFSYV